MRSVQRLELKVLSDLPTDELAVLELLAVCHGFLTRPRLSTLLARLGLKDGKGRPLAVDHARPALARAAERGWVVVRGNAVGVHSAALDALTWSAVKSGRFDVMVRALEAEGGAGGRQIEPHRLLRWRLFGGESRKVSELLEEIHRYRLRGDEDLELLWLRAIERLPSKRTLRLIPEAHVDACLAQNLAAYCGWPLAMSKVWLDFLKARRDEHPASMELVGPAWAEYHALRAEADEANAVLAGVLEETEDVARHVITVRALSAIAVEDRDAFVTHARALLEMASADGKLARLKVPGFSGPLVAVAAAALGDEDLGPLAEALVAGGMTSTGSLRNAYKLVGAFIAHGKQQDAQNLSASFSSWIETLCGLLVRRFSSRAIELWMHDKFDPETPEREGFVFVARQLQGLADEAHALGRRAGIDEVDVTDPAGLCTWYRPAPRWARVLAALEAAAPEGRSSTSKGDVESRLAWVLSDLSGSLGIEPRLQTRKDGGWTKGRKLAFKRIAERPAELPLSPEDSYMTSFIRRERTVNGDRYYLAPDAVLGLIGHPAVYWDGSREPVEVRKGAPELRVQRKGDRLHLEMHPALWHSVTYEIQGANRLVVFEADETQRQLGEIVGEGVDVPEKAEARVASMLSKLSNVLTIQSDVATSSDQAEPVEADPRLFLQVVRTGDALRIRALVYPLGEEGPSWSPGEGRTQVIAQVKGRSLKTQRDLSLEQSRLDALVEACPPLSRAADGPYSFATESLEESLDVLLALQGASGVVLQWRESEPFKLVGERGLGDTSFQLNARGHWFALEGGLAVDEGMTLSMADLLRAAAERSGRFITLSDGRIIAITRELEAELDTLTALTEVKGEEAQMHGLALLSLDGDLQEDRFILDPEARERMTKVKEAMTLTEPLPTTLKTALRDYQQVGFEWMTRLAHMGAGACLADDMGLGKTVQALSVFLHRAKGGPALVVAPTSVCSNWVEEIQRFAPSLRAVELRGGERENIIAKAEAFDVVICSYGILLQDADLLTSRDWHTVLLDEAQAIKNASTQRAKTVRNLRADFRVATTGTPMENHLGELWSLFEFLNPGFLGTHGTFERRFATPIQRDKDRVAMRQLKRIVSPFILRRTKTEVLTELPPRTEVTLHVELSAPERAFYESLRRRAMEGLSKSTKSGGQARMQVLAELMRLRRACCHPSLVSDDIQIEEGAKLAALEELLTNLREEGHKALVFSQFVDHLALVRARLDRMGITYQYLDGSTPAGARKKRIAAFQAGEGDVFLISLKAGGTGLNLTAADYVVHMDPWWNPAAEDQASDRAHRIGQTRPVTIYRLIANQTVEDKILKLHGTKRDLADRLLEGADGSSKLSAEDLVSIIREAGDDAEW